MPLNGVATEPSSTASGGSETASRDAALFVRSGGGGFTSGSADWLIVRFGGGGGGGGGACTAGMTGRVRAKLSRGCGSSSAGGVVPAPTSCVVGAGDTPGKLGLDGDFTAAGILALEGFGRGGDFAIAPLG
jgi:hypothetical protein